MLSVLKMDTNLTDISLFLYTYYVICFLKFFEMEMYTLIRRVDVSPRHDIQSDTCKSFYLSRNIKIQSLQES